ncbi:MAG: Smr/MutS family protein [Thermodesulfobacteriota bacterium]
MSRKSSQLLEFPKVLADLAGYARSEAGAAACLALAPLEGPDQPGRELALTRQWMAFLAEQRLELESFPDLDGLFAYLARPAQLLDLDALFALAQVLRQAKVLREALAAAEPGRFPDLPGLAEFAWPQASFSGLRRCLGSDGRLKDESSPELYSVRSEIRAIHQRCTKRVRDFLTAEDVGQFLQDDFMTVSSDRYVLPIRTNFKGRVQGIIHDYSQTGETCYVEPMFLVELNNQLQDLKQEEREAEKAVLRLLTSLARQEEGALRAAYAFLLRTDVLGAKAAFAAARDARPIEMAPGLPLRLADARHPLLSLEVKKAVPVDIELREEQRALVISGGNAGGKTVALKTLGLTALMTLSGLPAPCAEGSTLPGWREVVVVLGDEQSIEDSLSTFTAQIRALSNAWERIDDRALVIMDEFGAGTDPSQGAALAQAVVDRLLARGAWVAAATHFPALKAYALSREGVRAASVLFDPASKRPLYRLAYDQVGASQALDVAREHGLPEEVLSVAERYMLLDGADTSGILERLNTLAVAREKELAGLRAEQGKLREKRERLAERFEKEKRAVLDELRAASQSVLRQWQEGRLGRKEALRKLAESRQRAADSAPEPAEAEAAPILDWVALAPGSRLVHTGLNKAGVVVEKDEKARRVKLDLGGLTVWAEADKLAPAGKPAARPVAPAVSVRAERPAALRLDLRGERAEAAEAALLRFLDRAVLAGQENLEIVHGKGSGVLRKEVHRILREFPAVKCFSLAPEDLGGDGMTQVEMK